MCRRIPRDVLETMYGITLSKPEEWEDPDRPPYAEEFLDAYSRKLEIKALACKLGIKHCCGNKISFPGRKMFTNKFKTFR